MSTLISVYTNVFNFLDFILGQVDPRNTLKVDLNFEWN
jgi:hypothetical protein